ncbi:hypothetical protein [Micromonospora sp. NBC_01796]|uniref:hypothetical protein n=1 Tax=Micromonospora sp. NBC_01796 TaxID=2975987 RepID=UPI002DDBD391|nr:hypothetical protein [Micromonospora sp. NBC_01796]WSA83744.1 hypothetical protein OIE47_25620 [Micromonospora sp. NBC_01796]
MTGYRIPDRAERSVRARVPGRPERARRRLTRLVAHTDPVALAGIGLSVALSVALDLTGAASGVESLFAGLLGTTISLLVDSIARAERRFELRTLVAGEPWLTEALVPIMTGTREAVEHYPDTRVAAEARRRFDRLRVETGHLRAGRIIRPGTDHRDLIEATRDCVGRLDAITNVLPWTGGEPNWWGSDVGRYYWTLNLQALARGVTITRIFGYHQLTDQLRELVDDQRRAGVRVGLLPWRSVDRSLDLNLAVWDGTSAWEGRMTPHGEIGENVFSVNPDDLDRLRTAYQTCARVATFTD